MLNEEYYLNEEIPLVDTDFERTPYSVTLIQSLTDGSSEYLK